VRSYFLYDGLGSTTGLTNASGTVTDTYSYDVFGAMKTHTGASSNPYRFTGELNDSTVARSPYYLRARYYDPVIGRFLSRDPWPANPMNPQSLGRYAYVLNNPLRYVDPFGLCNAEGGNYCARFTPSPCRIPTPDVTPPPGYRRSSGGDSFFSKAWNMVKGAVQDSVCGPGTIGNFGTLSAAAVLCPEYEPAREWVGDQLYRSSDWFNNTCPGQMARTAVGATITAVGIAASEQGWGIPVATLGLAVIFAGPPGSLPMENCSWPWSNW